MISSRTAPSRCAASFGRSPRACRECRSANCLPRHAQVADKFTLIRSLHHTINIHNDGSITVLTGKEPTVPDPTSTARSEHPDFGMITSRLRGPHPRRPAAVRSMPAPFQMTRPTYLGSAYQAIRDRRRQSRAGRVPQLSLRGMTVQGLDNRRRLLGQFDGLHRNATGQPRPSHALDQFHQQAYERADQPRRGPRLRPRTESQRALRDRYGRHLWGQACLLARRLAEAGTAVSQRDRQHAAGSAPSSPTGTIIPATPCVPATSPSTCAVRLPYFDQSRRRSHRGRLHPRPGSARCWSWWSASSAARRGCASARRTTRSAAITGRTRTARSSRAAGCAWARSSARPTPAANIRRDRPATPQDLLPRFIATSASIPSHTFTDSLGRPIPVLHHGQVIRQLI